MKTFKRLLNECPTDFVQIEDGKVIPLSIELIKMRFWEETLVCEAWYNENGFIVFKKNDTPYTTVYKRV